MDRILAEWLGASTGEFVEDLAESLALTLFGGRAMVVVDDEGVVVVCFVVRCDSGGGLNGGLGHSH